MKKIVFVGILLVSGLFSLQYTLMNNYGWVDDVQTETSAFQPDNTYHYEVIYICPDSADVDLEYLPPKI